MKIVFENVNQKAALLMLVASVFFAGMSACVKFSLHQVSFWQAVFFRAAVGIIPIIIISSRSLHNLKGTRRWSLVIRGIMGFASLTLGFYSLRYLSLGTATILITSSPIFLVIFGYFFLQERSSKIIFFLLPLFLLGVGLVVKPSSHASLLPALAALTTAVLIGATQLTITVLGRVNDPITIVFYFLMISLLGSLVPAYLTWKECDAFTFVILIMGGLLGTPAQLLMTKAFQIGQSSLVGLIGFVNPVFAFVLDMLLFQQTLNTQSFIGAFIVLCCASVAMIQAGKTKSTLEM